MINPEKVSLVAMGYRGTISAEEDLLCARLIASHLDRNFRISDDNISNLKDTSGKRFFDHENIDFSPPTDFFLCTMIDRFNFALKATMRTDGNVDIMRVDQNNSIQLLFIFILRRPINNTYQLLFANINQQEFI